PSLGIMKLGDIHTCVLADLPGLIEGAREGKGLGDKFLRHIERTRIILHLVDTAPLALKPPVEAYKIIRKEVAGYSPALAEKPEIVLATKVDALEDKKALAALKKLVKKETGGEVLEVSAAAGTGLKDLARRILKELIEAPALPAESEH
ncbi:MAG TPA: GTPase, partial [Planctomycetota bacterium]|nr:GTPase [Planctomycetota bacterium]